MSDVEKILTFMNAEFQKINTEFQKIADRLDRIESRVEGEVIERLNHLEAEMRQGFSESHTRLDVLQMSLDRVEHSQQDEIIGMLKLVKIKTETNEYKIDSINKRLLEAEAQIERFSSQ